MPCPVCNSDICSCANILHDAFIGGGPADTPPPERGPEVHHVPPANEVPYDGEVINVSPEVHREIHNLDHEFDDRE